MSKVSFCRIAICVVLLIIACAVPFGVSSNTIYADTVENRISATVIGESSIKVDPDCANVFVSIQNVDIDAAVSKEATLDMYTQALDALAEWGIEKPDINLTYFRTYPSYDYQECRTLTGYYAVLNFSFLVKNLENLTPILDKMFEIGINEIDHINFELSETASIYNDLLARALDNARNKAQILLGDAEINLVKFKEENVYNCTSLYKSAVNAENIDLTSQITLTAKVTATFK